MHTDTQGLAVTTSFVNETEPTANALEGERVFAVKRQQRIDEYRRLAKAARDLADAAGLDQVRDKHTRSAEVWAGLADSEEHRGQVAVSARR